MAKMFYTAEEVAKRLGKSDGEIKELIRNGKLREFRDAGKASYKVQDVDALAVKLSNTASPPASKTTEKSSSASASGEIVLEAVEDSGIELAPSGSDIVSLEDVDAEDTRTGMRTPAARPEKAADRAKEGSSVASVGVNIFDDDELDEVVDPLAQTAVTDIAGLGIEGVGSGSGIMDLTRESDDTSLGAELLEEIYTGEEGGKSQAAEDTRAGLDAGVAANVNEADEELATDSAVAMAPRRQVVRVTEFEPDAWSTALTAALVVGVVIMWFGGLAGVSLVRGVTPGLVEAIYANLWIYSAAALVLAGLAAVISYFIAKRSS